MTSFYLLQPGRWAGLSEATVRAGGLGGSPVLITGVKPLKTGLGQLQFDFVQPLHPGGGRLRTIAAKVVQKTPSHMTCVFEEGDESRTAVLTQPDGERIRGRPFHVSNVQGILDNPAYMGTAYFNKRDSSTGELRPQDEWIAIPVPAIVSEEKFFSAQTLRASRDPRMGTTAVKTNTNLLTGQVVCGCGGDGCGGGMTTATGKSGQYRYYACRNRISGGPGLCQGRRIPMEKLDDIVVTAIADHVLRADRLQSLLREWLERAGQAETSCREETRAEG